MSHTIHTTPGLIIESRPSGEADKMLSIFTRDLGLVRAVAQGIRLEKSKLRYYTQEYSLAEFSLVRGKELWRLTNAREGFGVSARHADSLPIVHRVALLLRRLLHGEEPHPELFAHIQSLFEFFSDPENHDAKFSEILESLIVYRIFYSLGYIGADIDLDTAVSRKEINIVLLNNLLPHRQVMNGHINKAFKESQL